MSDIRNEANSNASSKLRGIVRAAWRTVLYGGWLIQVLLAAFLIALSFYNYLLFHTLAEAFAIIIAVLMCVVTWQTYTFSRNSFLMYLANGFFWIAMLDLVHALVYKGMSIFPIVEANPATQFWIVARYYQALLLLTAPLFLVRPVHKTGSFIAFGAIAVVLYAAVMTGNFPDAFIEGQGLTPFKVNSEYVIIAILVTALVHMWLRRRLIENEIMGPLALAMVLTMGAELAFTYYVSVYGLSNLVGHIFKLFSFWLIFVAIVRMNLIKPYNLLNEEVERRRNAEENLRIINEELEQRVEERTASLRDSEKSLSNAQHLAHIGNWSLNLETDELIWSDEIYQIFGVDKAVFGDSLEAFLDMVHPDDRERVESEYAASISGKHDYDLEHRIIRKSDGSVRWVHEKCEHIRNDTGDIVRSDGTVQDITERKEVEDLASRFGHIVEQSLNEIYIFDAQTLKFIQANQGACVNIGYNQQELRNLTPLDIKPDFTPIKFEEAIRPLRDGDKDVIVFEAVHQRKDGSRYDVEVHLQLMREEAPPVFVAIIQDITERKVMQQAILQNEKMASLGSLTAGMAHELNNPLGAILQNAQNVARRLSDKIPKNVDIAHELDFDLKALAAYMNKRKIPALLDGMSEAGERAAEIIEGMTRLSQTGGVGKVSADLSDLIETAISMAELDYDLKHTHHFDDIEIIREYDSALPSVRCLTDDIERVVLGVLRNATQAMSDQEHPHIIIVRTKRRNDLATIEIEDNGPGMEKAVLERIFDPFFTTCSPQRKGLGLSIAFSVICDSHGGLMRAESQPNKGTKIILELPLDDNP